MIELSKRVFRYPGAAALRLRARWSTSKVGVALVYHRLAETSGDPGRELVPAHGRQLFAAHLRHLRRHYRVVPAGELLRAISSRSRGQRFPVSITFDDDEASHATLAMPELLEQGLPACFFLNGAFLEQSEDGWWERLQAAADRGVDVGSSLGPAIPEAGGSLHSLAAVIEELPPARLRDVEDRLRALVPDGVVAKLSLQQARSLAGAGFEIGFHTRGHRRLTTLDERELEGALSDGREELSAQLGVSLELFAYPHGKADAAAAAAVRRAGFAQAFTTAGEVVTPASDRFTLPRVEPPFDHAGRFAMLIATRVRR